MRHRSFFKVLILGLAIGITICARPHEARAASVVDAGDDLFHTVFASTADPLGNMVGVPLGTFNFGSGAVNVGNTDTIVQRDSQVVDSGGTGTTSLTVLALQLASTTTPGLFVTLNPNVLSTGSMTITFATATNGTFTSTLDVNYDVHSGSVAGPVVGTGTEMFTATDIAWGRTAPPGAITITGVNYLLNGSDTSADFWPVPFQELTPVPTSIHSVDPASVPEPSTWIMLASAGLIVPVWTRWGRRRV